MAVRINIKARGQNLDLPPNIDSTFFITKQIHDILKGLSTREGDFTRAIALPNTANNQVLTEALAPINFTRTSNDLIPCSVLLDGVTVIDDGKLLVTKVDRHLIYCNIFGGNANFFSQLKDEQLSELVLDRYNFTFDGPGLTPLLNTTTGVVWANSLFTNNESYRELADLNGGDLIGSEFFNFQWGGVWFYIDTLLEVIFSQLNGLKVDRSALDEQFKKNAIAIPLPHILEAYNVPPGYRSFGENPTQGLSFPNGTTVLIPTVFNDPGLNWNGTGWVVPEAGLTTIRFYMSGGGSTPDVLIRPTVEVLKNGAVIEQTPLNVGWNFFTTFQATILTSIQATAGDLIVLRVNNANNSNIQSFYFSHSIERAGANDSRDINIADFMPAVSQKSFVLNCFKLYNIVANEKNGVVYLRYWDEILTRPPALITDFADNTRETSTLTPAYGQNNVLQYKPNDLVLRNDAAGNFLVNSNYLDEQKIIIEVLFSASDQSEAPGNDAEIVALTHYVYNYEKIENNKMTVTTAGTYTTTDANGLKAGDVFQILPDGQKFQVATRVDSKNGTVVTPGTAINQQDWHYYHVEATDNGAVHIASMETENAPLTYYDGAEIGTIGAPFDPLIINFTTVNTGAPGTLIFQTTTNPITAGWAVGMVFKTNWATYADEYTITAVTTANIQTTGPFDGATKGGVITQVNTTPGEDRKKAVFTEALLFSNILDQYFSKFKEVILSPAIVYAWLNISVIEFVSIDQTAPIYIKSLGQYFYVNKIEQFKTEGLTRFELIKI